MAVVTKPEANLSSVAAIWPAKVLFLLAILISLVLLVLQARHFFPFFADDAFISLRYSQRLIEGKGLTWSSGQRVEGYTNLLWVLLCAALGKLGMDLVLAARLLGVISILAAFAALVTYIHRFVPAPQRPLAAICSLVPFALSSAVAVWMIGGLEQPLLVALLAWAIVGLASYIETSNPRILVQVSLLLAGVTLTRADGFLFPILIASALLLTARLHRDPISPCFFVLAGPALAYLCQLAFRMYYYGEWLPNTAYVKVSFTMHRLLDGRHYVLQASHSEISLVLLGTLGCLVLVTRKRDRALSILYLTIAIGVSLYLILVGGDIFQALRHFLSVILVLCFAAVHASSAAYGPRGKLRLWVAIPLVCLAALTVRSRIQARGAVIERWEWQNQQLGSYLKNHFPPGSILVADAAGAIPFYSGMEAIDPLGLNDRHIAHQSSAARGHGMLGHELGDGTYVLDQRPAIIIFGATGHAEPWANSDFQIVQDPRFSRDYELQRWRFEKPSPWTSEVYVRKPGH